MARYFLIALWLLAFSTVSAHTAYPANPSVTDAAIYISHNGVGRYDAETLKPAWYALVGVATFEPVVAGELVLVGSTAGVYALHRGSGNTVWQIRTPMPLFSPTVDIDAGMAFIGGQDGSVRAVSMKTGYIEWQRRFEGWIYPPAALGGRLVVGGSSGSLRALDAETGSVLWNIDTGHELVYRPLAVDSRVVVITLFDGTVAALQAKDGKRLWAFSGDVPSLTPTATHGLILVPTFDGRLRAVDVADGKVRWTRALGGRPIFQPNLAQGIATIANDDGHLAALRLTTGDMLWRAVEPMEVIASPIMNNNMVVVFVSGRHGPLVRVHEPE